MKLPDGPDLTNAEMEDFLLTCKNKKQSNQVQQYLLKCYFLSNNFFYELKDKSDVLILLAFIIVWGRVAGAAGTGVETETFRL